MSPKSVQRFWDDDMHKKKPAARRVSTFERDAAAATKAFP